MIRHSRKLTVAGSFPKNGCADIASDASKIISAVLWSISMGQPKPGTYQNPSRSPTSCPCESGAGAHTKLWTASLRLVWSL
jgi:hypothetical protein